MTSQTGALILSMQVFQELFWEKNLPIMSSEPQATKDNDRDLFIMLVCTTSTISNCLTKGLKGHKLMATGGTPKTGP